MQRYIAVSGDGDWSYTPSCKEAGPLLQTQVLPVNQNVYFLSIVQDVYKI